MITITIPADLAWAIIGLVALSAALNIVKIKLIWTKEAKP